MGWVKIDDRMAEHPKMLAAGPLAGYLHVCAIQYANRNRTDGFVPARAIYTLIDLGGFGVVRGHYGADAEPEYSEVHAAELADALVTSGLWERVPNGYRVHDYLDYQNSAAEIDQYRAKDRARKPRRTEMESTSVPNGFHADSTRIPPRKKEKKEIDVDVPQEVNDPDTSDVVVTGARARATTTATAGASARKLTPDAQQFLQGWCAAQGKRRPPPLNPTQQTKLEAAVDDLGLPRLLESATWAAEHGVTDIAKCISAARTKRQRDEEPDDARATAVGPRGDNGRGTGPRLFGRQQTSGAEMRRQAIALGLIEDPDARPAE
jgi:hypothetical protein